MLGPRARAAVGPSRHLSTGGGPSEPRVGGLGTLDTLEGGRTLMTTRTRDMLTSGVAAVLATLAVPVAYLVGSSPRQMVPSAVTAVVFWVIYLRLPRG
mgnify:CR=1 FL=1